MKSGLSNQPRGFTLIEVLVAIAIMALVAAGLAGSLHVAFKARRSATEGNAPVRAARIALDAVARDLELAMPPTGVMAGAFTGYADTGNSSTLTCYSTSSTAIAAEARGDLQRVTFSVVNPSDVQTVPSSTSPISRTGASGPDGVLVRRATRDLLASVESTPADQVLCRNVASMTARYFDGSDWIETWDSSSQGNALPIAVEVTLTLSGDPGFTLSRVVRLPCCDPAALASASTTGGL